MINVAINGFGRIGRMVMRSGWNDKQLNFVAINDLTDTKTLAHLLKYDSVHGKWDQDVTCTTDSIFIGKKKIKIFAEKDPEKLPWKLFKVDVVVESTGLYLTTELASKHLAAGAGKVLLSAPCSHDDKMKTFVYGVNHQKYKNEKIVSNASCTTNCLAPLISILHKEFGIAKGYMTTVHAYTNDQRILDLPHKDLRRARAAAENLIPTSTGAAFALGKVISDMEGRLHGISIRVPVKDGSLIDLSVELKKKVTVEQINAAVKKASLGAMKGVIEYSEEPLVSTDIIDNPASCIFDAKSTLIIQGNFVKVLAWYDNEWGYSCRMVDMIKVMG